LADDDKAIEDAKQFQDKPPVVSAVPRTIGENSPFFLSNFPIFDHMLVERNPSFHFVSFRLLHKTNKSRNGT